MSSGTNEGQREAKAHMRKPKPPAAGKRSPGVDGKNELTTS